MRNLGFIKRACLSFNDPVALKTLYCCLVHSNLGYCLLIWINNNIIQQNDTIESVQNNFLCFISHKFNIPGSAYESYHNVLSFLNFCSFNDRRSFLLSKFLRNLILGIILTVLNSFL